MRRALRRMALAAACAIAAAHATAAMTPDPTGLWYDPAESGWGIALAQQGDTAFAVLFVYDPASHPAWYFASDLATPETFGPVPGGPGLSGTLYRAMGPWFGGAFDPRAVTPTAVGSLSLQYTDANHRSLRVDYVIDGTTFTKLVQAQTWRDDFARLLPGTYEGGMWLTGKSATNCEDAALGPFVQGQAFNFGARAGPSSGQVNFYWGTGGDTACTFLGDYAQRGQLASISGSIQCGPIGFLPEFPGPGATPMQLDDLSITEHGFSGRVSMQAGTCSYSGHVGGVRLP